MISNGVKAGASLSLSVLDVLSESGVLSLPDAESLSDAEVLSGRFSLSGVLSLFGSELLSAAPWFSSGGSVPVSYTHLDVYKRQVYYIMLSLSCQV